MRNSVYSDTVRAPQAPDRKIGSKMLLAGMAVCLTLGAFHVDVGALSTPAAFKAATMKVVAPLMTTIGRHTHW